MRNTNYQPEKPFYRCPSCHKHFGVGACQAPFISGVEAKCSKCQKRKRFHLVPSSTFYCAELRLAS